MSNRTAKQIIRYQVERTVREHVDAIDTEFLTQKASRFVKGYADEIATAKRQLADGLPAREFKIFTGTNAIVFALLAIATLVKRRAGLHLVPPAAVLLVAATLTAYLYLFNQNWLHTIVFSDYVGFTYIAYLSVAFFFLCDILFNRARITSELLNRLLDALGSAASVVPC